MSTPSISTEPSQGSTSLKRICKMELLPAPVRPTIPTFIPACISKLRFLTDGSSVGLYFIEMLLNLMAPFSGQPAFAASISLTSSSSWSNSVYFTIRCEEVIKFQSSASILIDTEKWTTTSVRFWRVKVRSVARMIPLKDRAKQVAENDTISTAMSKRMFIHLEAVK